ncbi:MAG: dihydropteroate synthase [Pseudoflavonifractor sp.]|nr:dihydropteroate synthase [Pseudoflavonifractor sp.]
MMTRNFTPFTLNLHGRLHTFDRPQVMGIINITPDSFYAGSRAIDEGAVARRVERLVEDGADMIDIGAYSSRPGAADVTVDEEIGRLSGAMRLLRQIAPDLPVSVDTFRAAVAKAAVEEMGADIVNDISGGDLDEEMAATVASLNVPYIIMHMRGTPATMMGHTDYSDVTAEVIHALAEKTRQLSLLGVCDVIVDPGFGFSKDVRQNYEMLANLRLFAELGHPLLVGISRKSMITRILGYTPEEALNGTTVLNTIALLGGTSILRVHDVREAREAVKLTGALAAPKSIITE